MDKPQVGEIWEELDGRFSRKIVIQAVQGETVYIATLRYDNVPGRKTKARLSRFNGKGRGYRKLYGKDEKWI